MLRLTEQPMIIVGGFIAGLVYPIIYLKQRVRKRREALQLQIDPALQFIANALQVTPSLEEALMLVSQHLKPPMSEEVTRVVYLGDHALKVCHACHTPGQREAEYCHSCGSYVGEHCVKCHRRLQTDWQHCPACGGENLGYRPPKSARGKGGALAAVDAPDRPSRMIVRPSRLMPMPKEVERKRASGEG